MTAPTDRWFPLRFQLAHVPPPGPWTANAACRGADPVVFMPYRGGTCRPARRICAACPVVDPCREYGLAHTGLHGVFGGLTERDRRAVRKTRRQEVA